MKFMIMLNKSNTLGQIPVEHQHEIEFFLCGNLDNTNHTIILTTQFNQEIGRLYLDSSRFVNSYSIDVVNHSLVKVKKINTSFTNLFYITRLNYWVKGSIKNGNYAFYSGIKKVACVETQVTHQGTSLVCHIERPEDVPFILLISLLFTQWHTTPLRLPKVNFNLKRRIVSA